MIDAKPGTDATTRADNLVAQWEADAMRLPPGERASLVYRIAQALPPAPPPLPVEQRAGTFAAAIVEQARIYLPDMTKRPARDIAARLASDHMETAWLQAAVTARCPADAWQGAARIGLLALLTALQLEREAETPPPVPLNLGTRLQEFASAPPPCTESGFPINAADLHTAAELQAAQAANAQTGADAPGGCDGC